MPPMSNSIIIPLDMKRAFFLFLFFYTLVNLLTSQNMADNTQIFSHIDDVAPQDSIGTAVLDFRTYPPTATKLKIKRKNLSVTISDEKGNLLFYTDMCGIYNKNHEMMPNGEFIADSNLWQPNCDLPDIQGTYSYGEMPLVILPNPDKKDLYTIFFVKLYKYQFAQSKPVYFTVDMSKNNGLGTVVEYNVPFAPVQSYNFVISAIRHANGNDWIIFLRGDSNDMLLYQFDSTGVNYLKTCKMPNKKEFFQFGNFFEVNQQGTKFCEHRNLDTLILYDFDRCDLTFSDPIFITSTVPGVDSNSISPSTELYVAAFSPNSKYLYVCAFDSIIQYDISSNLQPLPQKTIAYSDRPPNVPGAGVEQRSYVDILHGADDRLYIVGLSYPFIHVIHNPNEAGAACNFERDAINVPVLPLAFQNFPNYRLGAVDPPCTSAASDFKNEQNFSLFPNPAVDKLNIQFQKPVTGTWRIIDSKGQTELVGNFTEQSMESINIASLVSGIYVLCFFMENDEFVYQKFIISQ